MFVITLGSGAAKVRPAWQVIELHIEKACLNGVQAAVVANHIVVILAALSMIAEHAHLCAQARDLRSWLRRLLRRRPGSCRDKS